MYLVTNIMVIVPVKLYYSAGRGFSTCVLSDYEQTSFPLQAPLWPRRGKGIVLLFQDLRRYKGVRGRQHAKAALYPRERAGTNCTGGWVGLTAGMDGRKISPPLGFDPRERPARSQSLYRLSYPAHRNTSIRSISLYCIILTWNYTCFLKYWTIKSPCP
jgi:hypothetical protein